MNFSAELTPRQTQVAGLLAWGAAKKEVADRLSISERTVENTARSIYDKIGIQKATELSVWWFCTKCGVSFDLSPLKKAVIAGFLLLVILPYEFSNENDVVRVFKPAKTAKVARVARGRRRKDDFIDWVDYLNEV